MKERPYGIAALDRPRRLPRAGRIRLGEKQVTERGKEYPRELDYLNLADARRIAEFYAVREGVKPEDLRLRELDIIFPVNDPRTILDMSYMAYGQTGWKCRGNGEIAYNREVDDEIDCAGEDCKMVAEKKCKRQGRLTFVCYLVPGLCVYDIVTSSWRSIENCLAMIETLDDLFGRIDGIPLKMYREPYSSEYTDDEGKSHKQVHHCIRLDVAASLLEVKRLTLGGGEHLELPPASEECADDQYPRSIKQAEIPPVKPPEPILASVPEPLRSDILTGFEVCGMGDGEREDLLEHYKSNPETLLAYLNARADGAKPAPAAKPETNQGKPAKPQEGWSF
jgi:hypothetical protein